MKSHLFLNNPRGEKKKFNASRMIEPEDEITTKLPESYKSQKARLNNFLVVLKDQREKRIKQRTIKNLQHLEFVRIDFFIVFNDNLPFRTKTTFKNKFGLSPVAYTRYNQSVLFSIIDHEKFKHFEKIMGDFISSPDNVSPQGTEYSIITLIYNFEFLNTQKILEDRPQKDVIINLVSREENINSHFIKVYTALIQYIRSIQSKIETIAYNSDSISTIEIKNISAANLKLIADNFDIIHKIHSIRYPVLKPDRLNIPQLTWDFTISPPANKVIIGVLDNGVKNIAPLSNILVDYKLDITNKTKPNPLTTTHPHGTIVASLAAVGIDYFDNTIKNFQADAYILPMKILNFSTGSFNIYDIKSLIESAINKGVRIFNLSVCGPSKMYNETVSDYAYMLDKLTYENDILIFIATGNLDYDDIEQMQDNPPIGVNAGLHTYPNQFYNPYKASVYHVCEATNICTPSESHNNITIGAIADNMNPGTSTGLTIDKELPAFYTRKSHVDYTQRINGTPFSLKQVNTNINKPDIVMPGGDLLDEDSMMQVLDFGLAGNDFFCRQSGTSFSAPLAANLAAKIIGLYPALNMQSVKALILNSSNRLLDSSFLNDLVADVKQEKSIELFTKDYDELDKKEKRTVDAYLSSEHLYKKLVGYGMPATSKVLFSDSKSVTTIIQDSISVGSHKVINLNIPNYLLKYDKQTPILTLKATLCYKFMPVWNNHLAYNPIHISFNFTNSVIRNNPIETADIIADNDHQFYKGLTTKNATAKEKADAKKVALGIKAKLESWSEDFFPPASKPFSNTQQIELKINKSEIKKVNNQVSIAVRCTYKRDLDKDTTDALIKLIPDFSIALNISEKTNTSLSDYDLYDELMNCNELENISIIELEADIDLG